MVKALEVSCPGENVAQFKSALAALLADPDFRAAPRNKKFLQYVANEQIAGRGQRIKAYSVATEVFGRPSDFDPGRDPIVRIEAARLRAALASYYENFPNRSPVRIRLPKGSYVPSFHQLSEGTTPIAIVDSDADPKPTIRGATKKRWAVTSAIVTAILAIVIVATGNIPRRMEVSQRPLLLMEFPGPQVSSLPPAFHDRLVRSLTKFERWQVQDLHTGMPTTGGIRSAYILALRAEGEGVWWKLTDQKSGEVIGSDYGSQPGTGQYDLGEQFVRELAERLGGSQGLIALAEASKAASQETLGYGCIARMEAEIWIWNRRDRLPAVRDCLFDTLRLHPNEPQYMSALARVILRIEPLDHPNVAMLKEADRLVTQALAIRPDSSQGHLALALVRFRQGDFHGAAEAAQRAVKLNPADRVIQAYAGVMLFADGMCEDGAALMEAAERSPMQLPPEIGLFLAFHAFAHANYDEAIRRANRLTMIPSITSTLLRAASFAELGQGENAKREVAALLTFDPDIPQSFSRRLEVRGIPPAVRAKLGAALSKAGLTVS